MSQHEPKPEILKLGPVTIKSEFLLGVHDEDETKMVIYIGADRYGIQSIHVSGEKDCSHLRDRLDYYKKHDML